ncbi:MAG: hypothetical protein ACKVW3_07615 [Phycisphaerales bacterium]
MSAKGHAITGSSRPDRSRSRSGTAAPAVAVGAFGKHPGWDDHIDDPGIDTQRLIDLKQALYIQGIAGNIDSGAWERLDPAKRLDAFDHLLVVASTSGVAVARLWASRDGKGRAKYPLVAAADWRGVSLRSAVERTTAELERIKADAHATTSAQVLRSTIASAHDRLRAALDSNLTSQHAPDNPLAALASHPALGPDARGLVRVMYHVAKEVDRSGTAGGTRLDARAPESFALRVPAATVDDLVLWIEALARLVPEGSAITGILAIDHGWLDLVVGPISTATLFCLKATPQAVPFTSDIPYTIDDDFAAKARSLIAGTPAKAAAHAPAAAPIASRRSKMPLFAGGVGAILLAASGAFFLFQGSPKPPPTASPIGPISQGPKPPDERPLVENPPAKPTEAIAAPPTRTETPVGKPPEPAIDSPATSPPREPERPPIDTARAEAEAAKAREAEAAQAREAEAVKAREAEAAKVREAEAVKAREADAAKVREAEARAAAALEAESRAAQAKAAEARAAELSRIEAEQGAAQWQRAFSLANTPAEIDAIFDRAPAFNIDGTTLTDPRLIYNWSLAQLRRSAPKDDAPTLHDRVTAFIARADSLGPIGHAPAASLASELRDAIHKPPSTVDPAALGPATVTGFSAAPLASGGVRFSRAEPPLILDFLPVQTPGPAGTISTSFLCASELSLAAFNVAISLADPDGRAIRTLLPAISSDIDDPREGPRVWRWADGPRLAPASAWLKPVRVVARGQEYAPGTPHEPPTIDHPIQHIPPDAAALAARGLGCRLPTVAEWRAALDASRAATPTSTPASLNLRDATWKRHWDHVESLRRANPNLPSLNSFSFADALRLDSPGSLPDADGTLWFAPVSSVPGPFHHVLGNVAEFAVDPTAAPWPPADAPLPAIRNFLKSARISIVGLSSLSPPALADPPLATYPPRDLASNVAYADVGLRLAFSADGASIAEPLSAVVSRLATPERYWLPTR